MKSRYLYPIPFNKEILQESKYTAFIDIFSEKLGKTLGLETVNKKWPTDLRTKPELLQTLGFNRNKKIYIDGSPSTHNEENNAENAIDFLVPIGTPVQAVNDGNVIYLVENSDEYGIQPEYGNKCNVISILHTDNTMSEYIHLRMNFGSSQGIRLGDRVKKGQIIGYTGASGRMDLPHLHFALYEKIGINDFKNIKVRFQK